MLTFDGMVIIHNGDWLVDRKKYRVYINSPHGTVTATPKKGFPGTVVTLTNEPDLGYDFSSYTVQGATLSGNTFVIDHQDVYVTGNFSLHDYAITVTQPSGGTISAPSTAHYGDTVTLTNTPDAEHTLVHYIVNGEPIDGNTFVMPPEDVTITAEFDTIKYTITVTQPSHGSVYASTAQAAMGDTITLTSSPASHYYLDYYTVDGVQIQGNTFTMPNHDVTISASFAQVSYTITYSDRDPASPSTQTKGTVSGPTTAHYGDTITVTVTPDDFYVFSYVKVNNTQISGKTFTCTGNATVYAKFVAESTPYNPLNLGDNTMRFYFYNSSLDPRTTWPSSRGGTWTKVNTGSQYNNQWDYYNASNDWSYKFSGWYPPDQGRSGWYVMGANTRKITNIEGLFDSAYDGPTRLVNPIDTRRVTNSKWAFYGIPIEEIQALPMNACMDMTEMYANSRSIRAEGVYGSGTGLYKAYQKAAQTAPSGSVHTRMFYNTVNTDNVSEYNNIPADWK